MFVGNLMLVVLNIPLVGLFVSLLRIPQGIMSVLIVVFCVIGAYSLNNSLFDVGAMIGFGLLGYGLRRSGFDVAPLLLAFVLGPMFEQSLRQGLIIGYGDPVVFLRSPISAGFIAVALLVLLVPHVLRLARRPA
jgi:TctA family transporter